VSISTSHYIDTYEVIPDNTGLLEKEQEINKKWLGVCSG
jgi:hypothetical protein